MYRQGITSRSSRKPLWAGNTLNGASNWINQLRERRRLVKTQHCLNQLPDHVLRDIGLNRAEVRSTATMRDHANFQRRAI